MAMLIALVVAGLGYEVILVDNFPYNMPQLIINLVCGLGMGSLISFLAFMGLGLVYRMKLDRHREECRQLIARLLESRLGKPVTTPWQDIRDNRASEGNGRTFRVANDKNSSPVRIESAAQG
jgi:hypothetical protein